MAYYLFSVYSIFMIIAINVNIKNNLTNKNE